MNNSKVTPNQIITLKPGETITIKAVKVNGTDPILEDAGYTILPVPYFSQWAHDAGYAKGDCGPACVAGAVHFLTDHTPSVDDCSKAAGLAPEAKWASLAQIAKAGRKYGLKVRHTRPLQRDRIEKEIKAGFPVVALVKYDLLSSQDDPNQDGYNGAHFVLLIGFSEETVVMHDSDRLFGDTFGACREKPWGVFIKALMSTSKTPGNAYDGHGITFDV